MTDKNPSWSPYYGGALTERVYFGGFDCDGGWYMGSNAMKRCTSELLEAGKGTVKKCATDDTQHDNHFSIVCNVTSQ